MTRGFFVKEQGGTVIAAAKLSGSAYLWEGGYGEKILKAYKEETENDYLQALLEKNSPEQKQMLKKIRPEWYRKTTNSSPEDIFMEYGYVLREDRLFVYNWGELLFSVRRDTADIWLFIIQNLKRIYLAYLYSEEKLCIAYEKEEKMFAQLQKRIEAGCTIEELESELPPADYDPMILYDDHCMDATYEPDRPAYLKRLEVNNMEIQFIVTKEDKEWRITLQLPYMRTPILNKYSSEASAVADLRRFVCKNTEQVVSFTKVYKYVKKQLGAMRKMETFDGQVYRKELLDMYDVQPWLGSQEGFSIDIIIRELSDSWKRYHKNQICRNL